MTRIKEDVLEFYVSILAEFVQTVGVCGIKAASEMIKVIPSGSDCISVELLSDNQINCVLYGVTVIIEGIISDYIGLRATIGTNTVCLDADDTYEIEWLLRTYNVYPSDATMCTYEFIEHWNDYLHTQTFVDPYADSLAVSIDMMCKV